MQLLLLRVYDKILIFQNFELIIKVMLRIFYGSWEYI